ncbi:MAG: hypothetical protein M0P72_13965 [Metallibacterium scheffleri]|uniref:hypothetical protein n=1 Tax=Metallibacterium scheffleri TaxID=993689 RepID=UPI0026EA9EAE|nr:hypothetical protein [Metallibacterium scheffleri]MCK9368235.1 hypothetical protein [Metallibacterium scheffleri]
MTIVKSDNCHASDAEGTVVNLSSEFPIPQDDLHRDLAFPSMLHTTVLLAAAAQHCPPNLLGDAYGEKEFSLAQTSVAELWHVVRKGWSLTNNGKLELARKQFEAYREGFADDPELQYVLFDFCRLMLSPAQLVLFDEAHRRCVELATAQRSLFKQFKSYFISNIAKSNMKRYFNTFSEYFSCFSDFSQTLHHKRMGVSLSNGFVASSTAFSKTKLFYGNAFETLTSNVVVLACLSNVAAGRPYEEFKQFSLKKYLKLDKARRGDAFSDIPEFQSIVASLNSVIRNASHHGAMELASDGTTIRYRSGGTGAEHSMSYLDYIDHCNSIMMSCCALLALEFSIAF